MRTTIQVSDEVRQKLKVLATFKKTTYDKLLEEFANGEISKLNFNGIVSKLCANNPEQKSKNKRKRK